MRDGRQPAGHLRIALSRQHQRQQDVVPDGKGIQQIKILKHKPQVIPPECSHLSVWDADSVLACEQHLPAGGLVQRRQDIKQRGFARTGFPHDRHIFPFLHCKVYVGQGLHLIPSKTGGVDFFHVLNL